MRKAALRLFLGRLARQLLPSSCVIYCVADAISSIGEHLFTGLKRVEAHLHFLPGADRNVQKFLFFFGFWLSPFRSDVADRVSKIPSFYRLQTVQGATLELVGVAFFFVHRWTPNGVLGAFGAETDGGGCGLATNQKSF